MNTSIFQNSNSKIWRISFRKFWRWISLDIRARYRAIWPNFCIFKLGLSCVLKAILTTFWLSFKKTFRAEILQIYELLTWKIDDFINSFWLYLTFSSVLFKCYFKQTLTPEYKWRDAYQRSKPSWKMTALRWFKLLSLVTITNSIAKVNVLGRNSKETWIKGETMTTLRNSSFYKSWSVIIYDRSQAICWIID